GPVLLGGATFEPSGNEGVAFVLDLTERKRAEYLTSQVFENSPDSVVIIGRDYRHQKANPVAVKRWPVPAEKFVGMHLEEVCGRELFEQAKPTRSGRFGGARQRDRVGLIPPRPPLYARRP